MPSINNFIKALTQKALASEHQYIPLAIIGLISFIGYYFIFHSVESTEYESITIRIIGGSICLLLLLKNYWPQKIRWLLPWFWYFTLLYCFPFFFTFMAFKNPNSNVWITATVTGLFFLMLLVDWLTLIILIILGVSASWVLYVMTSTNIESQILFIKTLPTYFTVIAAGGLFLYRHSQVEQEKLQTMKAIAANIAHELRTPLSAIQSGISGITEYFSWILEGYMLAKKNKLPVHHIGHEYLEILRSGFESISLETDHASVIVEMFLTNIKNPEIKAGGSDIFPISEAIEYALSHYPFLPSQKEKITWNQNNDLDFTVQGDKVLVVHILYNLIKNALYFIDKAEKGNISIWLETQLKMNILHFKDTGAGIPKEYLPQIFDRFFSRNTHQGTGIGLAFCKTIMENMGGSISCDSIEGEYVHFQLKFPIKSPQVVNS